MKSTIKTWYVWTRTVVPLENRNVFFVFLLIMLSAALDNINSMGVLTMSADIQSKFQTNYAITSWVLSGYALTLGSFIMITGKLADIIGPHNVFLIGLAIVWVCSLICAVLPYTSIIPLIVFRSLQGIGASSLIPSSIALAANYFSGERAKYLGNAIIYLIVVLVCSMGFGLIIGGAFSETSIGYKAFFYFSFAYAFVSDVALLFLIIPIVKTEGHNRMKLKNIDFVAAFLFIAGILLMILGLIQGGEKWRSAKAIAPLVVGFFTVISAFVYESFYLKRYQILNADKDPSYNWKLQVDLLFPPEIVKIPNFFPFLITAGLYYCTNVMLIVVCLTSYTYIYQDSPIISALKVFSLTVGLVFGALIYRESYARRIGLKKMLIFSALISLAGCIWISQTKINVTNAYWKYEFFPLFMYGYGINLFFNIYTVIVVENTPLHLQGVVNGVFQTCSQVLLSIGNALVPSILGSVTIAVTMAEKLELHHNLRTVRYVIVGFQAFAFVLMVGAVKTTSPAPIEETTVSDSETKDRAVVKSLSMDTSTESTLDQNPIA